MANFFDKDEKDKDEKEEIQKIKVGDTEFDPEELNELVGAGKKLREIEEKQGQPVDDILESWGKRGRRLGEYKKKIAEYESKEIEKNKPQEVRDEEQVKAQIVNEAKKYGLITKEELDNYFDQQYQTRRQGEQIYNQTKKAINWAKKSGYPETTEEKLLKYMQDPANPKDPMKAYKLMFEKEIDKIKEEKLSSIKRKGMMTNEETTAGAKTPERKSMRGMSSEELRKAIREVAVAEQ